MRIITPPTPYHCWRDNKEANVQKYSVPCLTPSNFVINVSYNHYFIILCLTRDKSEKLTVPDWDDVIFDSPELLSILSKTSLILLPVLLSRQWIHIHIEMNILVCVTQLPHHKLTYCHYGLSVTNTDSFYQYHFISPGKARQVLVSGSKSPECDRINMVAPEREADLALTAVLPSPMFNWES